MKKAYKAPVAKKVDYVFENQVVAAGSLPVEGNIDWHLTGKWCTWGESMENCNVIYNQSKSRYLNSCDIQGDGSLD